MKKFEKVYVGKGHMPKEDLDIIRITIDLDEIKELAYEFEGKTMVTLEVARMKSPDKFDRTHTVYGTIVKEETPKKKTSRKGKK